MDGPVTWFQYDGKIEEGYFKDNKAIGKWKGAKLNGEGLKEFDNGLIWEYGTWEDDI